MYKMPSRFLIPVGIFFIMLQVFSCTTPERKETIATVDRDSGIVPQAQASLMEHTKKGTVRSTYTKNPLYYYSKTIYLDSLSGYYKYTFQSLEKLPEEYPLDSLKEIVFLDSVVLKAFKDHEIYTEYSLFILGELKIKNNTNAFLLLLNYHEGWGKEICMLSVDKSGEIIDMEIIMDVGGDGPDFVSSQLTQISDVKYKYEVKRGYHSFTPVDTLYYNKYKSIITIYPKGNIESKDMGIDSNLTDVRVSLFK